MKKILPLLLIALSLFADANKLTLGAGLYSQTQPYKDSDALNLPTPIIFYDNSIIYARWTRFGLYFMGNKSDDFSWGASLTLMPRANCYESKNDTMEDKKSTWEGGLALGISKEKFYAELLVLHDILQIHNSYIGQVEVGYEYKLFKATLYPSLSLLYQPKEFIEYYYEPNNPKAGVNIALQTYISYPLSKKTALFCNIKAEKLSKVITDAPIVEDNFIYSSLISLIYTFDLN